MAQLVPRVPIPTGHLSDIYYFFLQKLQFFHGGVSIFVQKPHRGA